MQPPALDKGTLWKVIIDILTEPTPRQKLDHINFLDDVVELLRGSKNVIVLTGAGVCYLWFVFINKPCWNECAQSAHDKIIISIYVILVDQYNTVKPLLSRPSIKQTPSIKWTLSRVLKLMYFPDTKISCIWLISIVKNLY